MIKYSALSGVRQGRYYSYATIFVPDYDEQGDNGFAKRFPALNKNRIAEALEEYLLAQTGQTAPERLMNAAAAEDKPEQTDTPVPERKPDREIPENRDNADETESRQKPEKAGTEVQIPQYKPDSKFDRFRENLRPWEGGVANRSKEADPGGKTNKGMSQKTLNLLKDKYPEWNLPEESTDLTDKQITDLFRHEFYERTQIHKLNEVAGFDKTGSKLVEHVFDANVMTKPARVGTWVQESIDETIGTDLKVSGANGEKTYDGIMGSKTREALQKAVEQGKTKEISRKFWKKRYDYLKSLGNKDHNPGWWPRVESFKE